MLHSNQIGEDGNTLAGRMERQFGKTAFQAGASQASFDENVGPLKALKIEGGKMKFLSPSGWPFVMNVQDGATVVLDVAFDLSDQAAQAGWKGGTTKWVCS